MKTVLITGCSSGFGLEMARYFLERDWDVVATMRTPRNDLLPPSARLRILPLDVTDAANIRHAVEAAGPIDALVNNAGIGTAAPAELLSMDVVRDVFETNTFGTMVVTQAVLPQFRERRAGVIVNVTSSITLKPLPLVSAYRASKAAVNAFTETLAAEVAGFGIRAHLVLPGRAPDTRFGENGAGNGRMHGFDHEAYAAIAQQLMAGLTDTSAPITRVEDVTEAVWRAVTDAAAPLRIYAGADAKAWAEEM
jgi:NAD(P)-dependent dehydrogenase (short-subunit alcohol dehydrogenase family)